MPPKDPVAAPKFSAADVSDGPNAPGEAIPRAELAAGETSATRGCRVRLEAEGIGRRHRPERGGQARASTAASPCREVAPNCGAWVGEFSVDMSTSWVSGENPCGVAAAAIADAFRPMLEALASPCKPALRDFVAALPLAAADAAAALLGSDRLAHPPAATDAIRSAFS
jgi:hypothetical protein